MENAVNPIAEQVVDNLQTPNTNGIPGSIPGETKAETVQRLYKVTVDGEEMEVDEDELRRGYAHNRAASKRMEEAAMSRKEAEQVIRLFKENPRQAFQMLGSDARKFAEDVINQELRDSMMSPQEKELRDYKAKVDAYENERRQAQAQYEQQQMEDAINKQAESIQSEIISTLDTAGLPKTDRTVSRIVYYLQSALQAGYPNVGPKDVIEQVKQDYIHDFKSMIGGLSEDQIELFLGSDLVRKVAKSTVKAEKKAAIIPKEVNANRGDKKAEKKVLSPRDFFNNL